MANYGTPEARFPSDWTRDDVFKLVGDPLVWAQCVPDLREFRARMGPRWAVGRSWKLSSDEYTVLESDPPERIVLGTPSTVVTLEIDELPGLDGSGASVLCRALIRDRDSARQDGFGVAFIQNKILTRLQQIIREPYLRNLHRIFVPASERTGKSARVIAETQLQAEPRMVFDSLTDPAVRWFGIVNPGDEFPVSATWPQPGSVMTRYSGRGLVRLLSRWERERVEVVESDAPRHLSLRGVEWSATYGLDFDVSPSRSGAGSILRAEHTVELRGPGRALTFALGSFPAQVALEMANFVTSLEPAANS